MPRYKRLTQEQRYTIERLLNNHESSARIAKTIGVSPSTISRELHRNGMTAQSYSYLKAQAHADQSQRDKDHHRTDPSLWKSIESYLTQEQWSPQQISGYLRSQGQQTPSHETIYRHIYQDQAAGGQLHQHLRHKIKSYKKRGSPQEKRGRIKNQRFINERPAIVEERSRLGDWEIDTVIGRPGGKVLVTMVERKSRLTLMGLARNKEAIAVSSVMIEKLLQHRGLVKTLTYDNGKEFARHELISEILEADGYFAHPYHSWERGLNENTNGLIRQYLPKGSSFDELSNEIIQAIEDKLNTRPRKTLDYKTPNSIFHNNSQPPPSVALAA